jgi:hypothetical protein
MTCVIQDILIHIIFVVLIYAIMNFHMCLIVLHY